jgi:hypothetical protein
VAFVATQLSQYGSPGIMASAQVQPGSTHEEDTKDRSKDFNVVRESKLRAAFEGCVRRQLFGVIRRGAAGNHNLAHHEIHAETADHSGGPKLDRLFDSPDHVARGVPLPIDWSIERHNYPSVPGLELQSRMLHTHPIRVCHPTPEYVDTQEPDRSLRFLRGVSFSSRKVSEPSLYCQTSEAAEFG